jgi:hypothetical protein
LAIIKTPKVDTIIQLKKEYMRRKKIRIEPGESSIYRNQSAHTPPMLGIKPKASHMLSKCSTTEQHPNPQPNMFKA